MAGVCAPMTTALDVLALVLGVIALLVSVLAYLQSRPSAQLRRDQQAAMHIVASQALLTYDLLQIVNENRGHVYDNSLLGTLQSQAPNLEEALNDSIRLGLWSELVGGNEPRSLAMYSFFRGSLISAARDGASEEEWLKPHFAMGVGRIITLCDDYHRPLKGQPLGALLSAKVAAFGDFKQRCWNYLELATAAVPVV